MNSDFIEIIRRLRLHDPAAANLQGRIPSLRITAQTARSILNQYASLENDNEDPNLEFQALSKLVCILANQQLGEQETATAIADEALDVSRWIGDDFNEALVHWFLGRLHRNGGDQSRALTELSEALRLLESCAVLYESESDYKKHEECGTLGRKIRQDLNSIRAIEKNKRNDGTTHPPRYPRANLVYGVFDVGHASTVGRFIFDDECIGQLVIESVKFNDIPHHFHHLRAGNEVQLTSSGDYRLLRIEGDSMDQSTPIPIEPGDYILADLALTPQYGQIVIADLANPPTPQERACVIKRFTNKGLRSESRKPYENIPLQEAKIRGVVLAVAKPSARVG